MTNHTTYSWNLKWQKWAGMGLNGFILKKINGNQNIIEKKKFWKPFRIYLLNSTANPVQFGWNLARLAVLFPRQILNGPQDFFLFNILIFLKYETIETYARTFLSLIILAAGMYRVILFLTTKYVHNLQFFVSFITQ